MILRKMLGGRKGSRDFWSSPGRYVLMVACLGIGSQLSQIILLREMLMVFQGNELSIALVLASWLFWCGVGSFLGSRRPVTSWHPFVMASSIAVLLLIVQPLTLLGLRWTRYFLDVRPGELLSLADLTMVCVLAMGPVCMLWGGFFVSLARLWRHQNESIGVRAGIRTYAFEAMGNLTGGLAFSLWLVHRLNSMQTTLLAVMLCALAMVWMNRTTLWTRRLLWISILVSLAFSPLWMHADKASQRFYWRQMVPDHAWVMMKPSRYGQIVVLRRDSQHAFFQSGRLAFSTHAGTADTPDGGLEEQSASHLAHLAMTQHLNPQRILLVGGGLRGVLREILTHPVESVDYVELDPQLLEGARPFVASSTLQALEDPRVNVWPRDGRWFVKSREGRELYDLVLVDMPDPSTAMLNRFYTREFFREIRRVLAPDAVVAITASSSAGLRDLSAINRNATLYHSLSSEFPHVLALGDRTLSFFATEAENQLSGTPAILQKRFQQRNVQTANFRAAHFHALLQDHTIRRINWILKHHGRQAMDRLGPPDHGPMLLPSLDALNRQAAVLPAVDSGFFINSDFRPVAYTYTLMWWDRHVRGGGSSWLLLLLRLRGRWLVLLPAFVLFVGAVGILVQRRSKERRVSRITGACAMLCVGFSTMAYQVSLLFAFQSQYGFVYEMIGMIVALFMGGLALGALTMPPVGEWRRLASLQVGIGVWGGILAVLLPLSARLTVPPLILTVFCCLTLASGFWNGLHFPVALACLQGEGDGTQIDPHVGMLYGMELLGACMGSILAGVIMIPILGMVASCLVAGSLNLASGMVILISWMYCKNAAIR